MDEWQTKKNLLMLAVFGAWLRKPHTLNFPNELARFEAEMALAELRRNGTRSLTDSSVKEAFLEVVWRRSGLLGLEFARKGEEKGRIQEELQSLASQLGFNLEDVQALKGDENG